MYAHKLVVIRLPPRPSRNLYENETQNPNPNYRTVTWILSEQRALNQRPTVPNCKVKEKDVRKNNPKIIFSIYFNLFNTCRDTNQHLTDNTAATSEDQRHLIGAVKVHDCM